MFDRDTFRQRREALQGRLEEGAVAVFAAAPVARRNGDVAFRYRPDSDLWYLTGFPEPEAIAVFSRVHPEHRFVLFVRPRDAEKEVWTGTRTGPEDATEAYGADAAFPVEKFDEEFPKYIAHAETLYFRLGDRPALDARIVAAIAAMRSKTRTGVYPPHRIVDSGDLVHEMRLVKSPDELLALRRSVDATVAAHLAAMREARPGMREFELLAVLEFHFRRAGGEPGYLPIVAAGANATVLHYEGNRRAIRAGDLVLIDAGAEVDFYTADITRTFPVRSRFSNAQRAIYEIVLAAHRAALALVRPGAAIDDIHRRAIEVLTQGMVDLGLCEGPVAKAIESEAYKKFYPHRTSHWLGMDVHDAGRYYVARKSRAVAPNMVITVEPGLYVPPDAPVDERWRGIGVRIEDDVLVTSAGHEVLTAAMPREIADVEGVVAV